MKEKQLLKKLGEETIYSAKSHFKAADLRRQLITITIWVCAVLGIVGLIGICSIADKITGAVGLLGTIALLIWNEGEGKNYRANHKAAAENYLSLHKEIRACYFLNQCNAEQVSTLNKAVINFDKSEKPDIPSFAKRLAKKAIESNDPETDNWFNNPESTEQ